MDDTIRVTVTVSLDVSVSGWNAEYGTDSPAAEVRALVKEDIGNGVTGSIHYDSKTWSNVSWK